MKYKSRSVIHLKGDPIHSGVPRNFVRGEGVQQIQLRTEDRKNGDLGAVALDVLEAAVLWHKKFHFI